MKSKSQKRRIAIQKAGKKAGKLKVVINAQYGGFNLSAEALKYLALKKSPLIDKMAVDSYYGTAERAKEQWEKEELIDIGDGWFRNHFGFFITKKDGFIYMLEEKYKSKTRCHPDLIEVVEKLGEKANGNCATLKIVEIPKGIDFEIEEYDGNEWVAETHQRWS